VNTRMPGLLNIGHYGTTQICILYIIIIIGKMLGNFTVAGEHDAVVVGRFSS